MRKTALALAGIGILAASFMLAPQSADAAVAKGCNGSGTDMAQVKLYDSTNSTGSQVQKIDLMFWNCSYHNGGNYFLADIGLSTDSPCTHLADSDSDGYGHWVYTTTYSSPFAYTRSVRRCNNDTGTIVPYPGTGGGGGGGSW